jgi:Mn-containing catalase
MYTMHIGAPDLKFGNMLLEQFGGANAGNLISIRQTGLTYEDAG